MAELLSNAAIPAVFLFITVTAFIRGVPVFDTFVEGAREGARTALNILPVMVGILAGVAMLNGSGLIDIMTGLLQSRQKPRRSGRRPSSDTPSGSVIGIVW